MEKKTFFIQFKSILAIGFLVFWGCAGVVYGGYEGGKEGFAESDIAKCLYFLMVGMVIVIVRRLRKKKNHVENNVSF
ncbi:MAG: hypothetical protein E3K37_18445 [Candidatus Kuenenia sp.]|nr:hypothetical protein [Candidatus Kuenenia hertensis]